MDQEKREGKNSRHSLSLVCILIYQYFFYILHKLIVNSVGPIDMTGETAYEAVNSLQNPNVRHGQNIYMRGVTQREYSAECAKKVCVRLFYKTHNF